MITGWGVLRFAISMAKSELDNSYTDDYDWRAWTVNVVRNHGSRRQAHLAGRAYDRTIGRGTPMNRRRR